MMDKPKRSVGRPTKYNDELLANAQKYLQECQDIPNSFPSIDGLAIRLNLDDETVLEWTKVHKEFSATVKAIKRLQRDRLQFQGLYGRANPTMAIFLLKANHGMIETERRELTTPEGQGVTQLVVVRAADEPKKETKPKKGEGRTVTL